MSSSFNLKWCGRDHSPVMHQSSQEINATIIFFLLLGTQHLKHVSWGSIYEKIRIIKKELVGIEESIEFCSSNAAPVEMTNVETEKQ